MKKFVKSLLTDGQWDGDLTKVFGAMMIVVGLVGWLFWDRDPAFVVGFGSALAASGKFSSQG